MTYPSRNEPPRPHPTPAGAEHRPQVPPPVRDPTAQADLWTMLNVPPRQPTYARFLAAVLRTLVDPGAADWRVGQTLANVLAAQRPDLAERLRASDLDTFHHDARVPYALRWLEVSWDARKDQEDQPTDREEENHDG